MNSLEAAREHCADSQERNPLGRPVARGTHAIALARNDDDRLALALISLRRAPDRQAFARARQDGESRRNVRLQQIADALVGEHAAQHDLPVAAPCCKDVEVPAIRTVLDQPIGCIAIRQDLTGWRNMVRRDVVAEYGEWIRRVGPKPRGAGKTCEWRTPDVG